MKKILLVIVPLILLAGCACPVEVVNGINQVEQSQNLIVTDYLVYVATDPKLKDDQKNDRVKLVESLNRLMAALKKAAKGE